MTNVHDLVDRQFLEMRAHVLSLAADVDRIARAAGDTQVWQCDQRIAALRQAIECVLHDKPDRAECVQLMLSDRTPVMA